MPALVAALVLAQSVGSLPAARAADRVAEDPPACRTVRMAEPGWSDIEAADALAGAALVQAGYRPVIQTLSVPIIFQALAQGQLDLFLGNWMPAQTHFAAAPLAAHRIELIRANLRHARFTLAVPDYVTAAGVRDVSDLQRFADRFGRHIYGIDPGAPADENLRRLIASGQDGLSDWHLVESSEFGMVGQLERDVARQAWIVFLAWEPNPMNAHVRLHYLSGGAAFLGPDYGASDVNTVTRAGLSQQCRRLGRLLRAIGFTAGLETETMLLMNEQHHSAAEAAALVLARHPELLPRWLAADG